MTHTQALEIVKESGITGPAHGDFARVKQMVEADPRLLEAMNSLDASRMDETPQGAAAHMGCKDILEYLLNKGVKLDIFMATALGLTDRVAQFLKNDPSLAKAKGSHRIALLSHGNNPKMAELLVNHGADPKADGPLNTAVGFGRKEMVEWLLAHGAKVTSKTDGTKALHIAVANGHKEIVQLLLTHGAYVNAKGNENKTWGGKRPLALAIDKGHEEIAKMLKKHGANI